MKIKVHPEYEHLRTYIEGIPRDEYPFEEVYCHRRNVVARITLCDKDFVVKKFKRPTLLNCLVYTLFRKSKARRAYENALLLLEKGVKTPFPVAYIEVKRYGFFHTGYFISEYMNLPTLAEAKSRGAEHNETGKRMGYDLILFTIDLQNKKVLPLDYNPSNIFYHFNEDSGHYEFALTDINRMRFGSFSWNRDTMRSFEQFGISTKDIYAFLKEYSSEKGVDVEFCMYQFLSFRLRKRFKKLLKNRVKERLRKE